MTNSFSKVIREMTENNRTAKVAAKFSSLESVDNQIVCLMRVLLAFSGAVRFFV